MQDEAPQQAQRLLAVAIHQVRRRGCTARRRRCAAALLLPLLARLLRGQPRPGKLVQGKLQVGQAHGAAVAGESGGVEEAGVACSTRRGAG